MSERETREETGPWKLTDLTFPEVIRTTPMAVYVKWKDCALPEQKIVPQFSDQNWTRPPGSALQSARMDIFEADGTWLARSFQAPRVASCPQFVFS